MKSVLVIAVGVLCSVSLFAAKGGGKPAGNTLSAICTANGDSEDACIATANGLVAGKTYRIEVRSNCSDINRVTFTAVAGANTIPITAPETNDGNCTTQTFFFYLYLGNKQVATTSVAD